jgi:transmembrane sensor
MKNHKEIKKPIDIQILMRYLKGNGSDEDRSVVKQWCSNHESENELYEKSLQFWDGIAPDQNIKGYSEAQILDHIHHRIRIEEAELLKNTGQKNKFVYYLVRIAAILFLPLLLTSLSLYFLNNSSGIITSYAEIHSLFGTRTAFFLPDGSTGWLNGGSSLKFPTQFGNKKREVELSGEAYFNVITNHKKPFIVSTGNIDVKVYGTSFNVMAYSDEKITEVTLERGQVEVFKKINNLNKSIGVLKPNESLIYNQLSDSSKVLSINSSENLSWIDGKLSFKYEPFEEVVRKINRWYNVNIVVKDKLLDSYIYYGTFKDETLEEVLNLLHFTAPIRYKSIDRERKQDGTFDKRKIEIYYDKKN